MSALRLSAILATVVGTGLTAASTAAAPHASYHTPGYRGTHRVPPVAARVPTPLTIGSGENPSILVDAAGTAHIVWNQPVLGQADQLHYCRLPRRATAPGGRTS
jgi:hypothetical protein